MGPQHGMQQQMQIVPHLPLVQEAEHRLAVLFCSLAVLDPRVGYTMDILSPLSVSSVILNDSSMESSVHVLMLSIQAVCGLPRLRAPGIVPCIISFSRLLPCFLMV